VGGRQRVLITGAGGFIATSRATQGVDEVHALAANMGGIGFIETNEAVIVRDNTLIETATV
jgi:hypothetical protein